MRNILRGGVLTVVLTVVGCQTTEPALEGPVMENSRTQLPREFRTAMTDSCIVDAADEYAAAAEEVCGCIVDNIAGRMSSNDMLRFIARLMKEAGEDEAKIQKMVNENAAIASSIYACIEESGMAAVPVPLGVLPAAA